jgi:hypothetical protein
MNSEKTVVRKPTDLFKMSQTLIKTSSKKIYRW